MKTIFYLQFVLLLADNASHWARKLFCHDFCANAH